jgi:hypothetical protein
VTVAIRRPAGYALEQMLHSRLPHRNLPIGKGGEKRMYPMKKRGLVPKRRHQEWVCACGVLVMCAYRCLACRRAELYFILRCSLSGCLDPVRTPNTNRFAVFVQLRLGSAL